MRRPFPNKIALRRAIVMGYNGDEEIRIIRIGQAMPASQPVPPGLSGHDPRLKPANRYAPAAARALLDKFGYKDRNADGYREIPDGKPLVIRMGLTPDSLPTGCTRPRSSCPTAPSAPRSTAR